MKTVKTRLPIGKIVRIEEMADGSYEVVQKIEEVVDEPKVSAVSEKVVLDDKFIFIEAESLSMDDKFMKYIPKTMLEKDTKELITESISKGTKNFWRPRMDASFTNDGDNICFEKGKKPAVGKSYNWWKKVAEEYCPERNSRLGTRLEYGAFLGVLIKKLVEEGKTVEWAWNAVCNDSKELGHYWNSEISQLTFEPTGSRCICGFYDLANTYKILAGDNNKVGGFWIAGGYYHCFSSYYPLADLALSFNRVMVVNCSAGWLVLS